MGNQPNELTRKLDMCHSCYSDAEFSSILDIDIQGECQKLSDRLSSLVDLETCHSELNKRGQEIAISLIKQYGTRGSLTDKQWELASNLLLQVKGQEPIYGSFTPITIMFVLAGMKGMKKPKVRLMSNEGRFVQLNFKPGESEIIDVYVDGWQGHGYRKFAGWVHKDKIVPYRGDRMSEDVRNIIQDLALDPIGTAKAMAGKLGVCMYCAKRLSDDRSKAVGYGPICAQTWDLPWG